MRIQPRLSEETLPLIVDILSLPQMIRGFDEVKLEAITRVRREIDEKLTILDSRWVEQSQRPSSVGTTSSLSIWQPGKIAPASARSLNDQEPSLVDTLTCKAK
jgi:hypothetical protein